MSPTQHIADRFEIRDPEHDLLGRGSMGEVYRATDTQTGETVAVKALDPGVVARDPGILERFVREGEALRQLNHPNIVGMVTAAEQKDRHYLVMEYVAGGSLHDLLEAQEALPIPRVLEAALDLADALTRAHRLGIIHRDLKPANVLLAEDGTPRLTDFGIAYMADTPRLTQTGILMGTVDYLSPEACEGEPIDERGDIWSFGVMLYEMLTGERPFGGKSLSATLMAILTQPVPDLGKLRPDAPEALVDLIYRMLEKDREQRIPSVRLVGAELEAILKGREVPTLLRLAPGETRFAPATPPAAAPPQPQVAHNLPAQLTSFVGRERETAEVMYLLETTRLLTFTGPPGTGKTRLGLRVATEVLDQFPDGVFFVDLAPIRDPGLVATTIAQVLGIGESGGQPLLDTLQNALRHKHLLLLLDNFEQVVDAAPLVGELLSASPRLKALVTSRETLRIYGEQEYPVPPLTLPALDRAEPLPSLSQYEAVELFTRRARAVCPDFALTEDNARAVAEICVRLDGLPLAIELAAARSTMLSPEMMRRRLENRLGVLVAGPRDLPVRQRTLRGTIDWSYDLIEPSEKTLFARLAVFQGGRSVEAVEAVCSHGLPIDVLAGLESLLNKNLLRRVEGTLEGPRFVMLEMIHEYAWERLEASGEAEDLRRRHGGYFLALAERAAPELRGARQQDWSVQLRAEHDNLRAALAWSLETGEAELGLRLVGALYGFWIDDGHSAEGLRWTERALVSGQDVPPAARAGALRAAGSLCYAEGENRKGQTYSREALAIYRELGDEVGSAWALVKLGQNAMAFPDECKEGIALCQEGLALFREAGHKPGIRSALYVMGELGRQAGDYDLAQEVYEESLALSRETGYKLGELLALANMGTVAMCRGLPEQARALYAESLALSRELGDKTYSAMHLAAIAGPVVALGYPQAAARLLGASEALLGAMGIIIPAADWSTLDRNVEAAREQLDEATFDAAWAEGRAMSLEQAISYALEAGQLAAAVPPPLPVREPEVAAELPAFLKGEEDTVPSPVFVARERELAQLDEHLDQALLGQGRVVFVTGEAGQGKTALVAEFARRAQVAHPDLIVASGNCNAHTGIGDPYLPFREILGLLTGDVEAQWAAKAISREQARRLSQVLPLTVQALVEAGPDLVDLLVPGAALVKRAAAFTPWSEKANWLPRVEELAKRNLRRGVENAVPVFGGPSLQQSALFEQYSRVLRALACQRPLLLVLDDLQWADDGSTNLLFHLGRRIQGSRVLIVGAYRPAEVALGRGGERHPLESVVNEFKRHFGDIKVDLGQAEGWQFIEAFLDTEPNRLGDTFRETLYRQTRGHPLSTVELLRDMQERGDLVQDAEGRWVEGPALDWEALPARVKAVISERIGRLAEETREALRVASVEGETFTAEVVARVLAADEREMVRCLSDKLGREHRLVSAQGIQWTAGQRLSVYRFRHSMFQRYLYSSLDPVERVHLHQAVGTALEALYGEGTQEIVVQLARHFQEAGVADKAVSYLDQAGDRASGLYGHQEAIDHYQQAMAAHQRAFGDRWDPVHRAALERKLGEALYQRGKHQQALDHLQRALAYLGQPLPTSRWGTRLAILREIVRQIGHRSVPGLLLEPMGGPISPAAEEEVRLYVPLGWIEALTNPERFLLVALKSLNVPERSGYAYGVAVGSAAIGVICDFLYVFRLAEGYHRRAVAIAKKIQHPLVAGLAYLGMSIHKLALGEGKTMLEFGRQSAEAYREVGALHYWAVPAYFTAMMLAYQGDLSQALRDCREVVRTGQDGADPQVQCWGLSTQGFVQWRLGQFDEAIAALREGLELAKTIPDHAFRISASADLGRCYLRQGCLEEAQIAFQESQRFYVTNIGGDSYVSLRNGLAEAYLLAVEKHGQNERTDWLKKAKRACRDALKQGNVFRPGLPEAMRLKGICEWLRGRHAAAHKWWRRSLALAEEMEQRYDLGVTHLEMGQRLGEHAHLERAEAILAEIGAEWDLARAREALGKDVIIEPH